MTAQGVRPLRPARWVGAPMLLCAAGSLVLAAPLSVAAWQLPEPVFGLVPAFAWAVIRPSALPPIALLALGVFLDLLWGTPLGLWPLCLLAAYGFTLFVRPWLSGHGFLALWAWYGAACAVGLGAGVALTGLFAGGAPGLIGVGLQWLVSAALFPLAWRLTQAYEDADVRFR